MKSTSEHMLWAIVAVLVGSPLTYVIAFSPSLSFWDSVFSGLIATGAALIGGVPVAFAIDRAFKRRETAEAERAAHHREQDLLQLLKQELSDNIKMVEAKSKMGDSLPTFMLQSSLWQACKSSGKLNDLRDISLLNELSSAYSAIEEVIRIERLAYKAAHSATVSFGRGGTAYEQLMRLARSHDKRLLDGLNELVALLNSKLDDQPVSTSSSLTMDSTEGASIPIRT